MELVVLGHLQAVYAVVSRILFLPLESTGRYFRTASVIFRNICVIQRVKSTLVSVVRKSEIIMFIAAITIILTRLLMSMIVNSVVFLKNPDKKERNKDKTNIINKIMEVKAH